MTKEEFWVAQDERLYPDYPPGFARDWFGNEYFEQAHRKDLVMRKRDVIGRRIVDVIQERDQTNTPTAL